MASLVPLSRARITSIHRFFGRPLGLCSLSVSTKSPLKGRSKRHLNNTRVRLFIARSQHRWVRFTIIRYFNEWKFSVNRAFRRRVQGVSKPNDRAAILWVHRAKRCSTRRGVWRVVDRVIGTRYYNNYY